MTPEEESAMYDREKILARIRKFDIYVKGGDGMSEEQADAFNKLIKGREEALATSLSLDSQEGPFIAADDQRDAFQKEFDCQVKFRIGVGHFRIEVIPNDKISIPS